VTPLARAILVKVSPRTTAYTGTGSSVRQSHPAPKAVANINIHRIMTAP
jgi:hypothetical protein